MSKDDGLCLGVIYLSQLKSPIKTHQSEFNIPKINYRDVYIKQVRIFNN
jgi:hypothetical protein